MLYQTNDSTAYKNNIIARIIDMEWDMFVRVQNIDAPAPCQSNRPMFAIMRYSQHCAFSEAFLLAYEKDLQAAKSTGRNLVTEKYAYMMQDTDPDYYSRHLATALPKPSPVKQAAIDAAMAQLQHFQDVVYQKYPVLHEKSRPLADVGGETSSFTYMCGELKTMSLETIQLYLEDLNTAAERGENIIERIYQTTASFYGREQEIISLLDH